MIHCYHRMCAARSSCNDRYHDLLSGLRLICHCELQQSLALCGAFLLRLHSHFPLCFLHMPIFLIPFDYTLFMLSFDDRRPSYILHALRQWHGWNKTLLPHACFLRYLLQAKMTQAYWHFLSSPASDVYNLCNLWCTTASYLNQCDYCESDRHQFIT